MKTMKTLLGLALSAGLLLPVWAAPAGVMYKDPNCGCCGEHAKHLRAAGFNVREEGRQDMAQLKARLGVPQAAGSCHTVKIGGYVVEGHVPAAAIAKLLRDKPKARGIAVPGMPADSPGMGAYKPGSIAVMLIGLDGRLTPYGKF